MAFNTTIASVKVIDNALRNTTPVEGTPFNLDQMNNSVLLVDNKTDQALTISTKWSHDGITYINVGTTQSVAAGATLVTDNKSELMTGLKLIYGYVKVVVTAAVAPTSGNVVVYMQGMNQ